MKSVDYIV